MPPQLPGDDSGSEAGDYQHDEIIEDQDQVNGSGDIGFKGSDSPLPSKEEAVKEEDDEDEEDEEEGEDQYQVEAIRKHKFEGKDVLYLIKWVGYKESENTWEPLENLEAADRILNEYHAKIGGPPQPPSNTVKKTKSTQSLRKQESHEDSPAPKRRKQESTSTVDSKRQATAQSYVPRGEDWEPEVDKVQTVERDDNGALIAFIVFKNGKKTKVGMDKVYRHCPRPMLRFYEEHLKFK